MSCRAFGGGCRTSRCSSRCLGLGWFFFQLLGNSTFGYVDTPSLYGWMNYAYGSSKDDELGYIIPLIVLGLCYWKRDELLAAPKRNWWPAMALVAMCVGGASARLRHPADTHLDCRILFWCCTR